jgi:hypothetical protein
MNEIDHQRRRWLQLLPHLATGSAAWIVTGCTDQRDIPTVGAASPSPSPSPQALLANASTPDIGGAFNFAPTSYFDGHFPFIDAMKIGGYGWLSRTGFTADADDNIVNLAPGAFTTTQPWAEIAYPAQVKTGTWVVSYESSGDPKVSVASQSRLVSNVKVSERRVTFDLAQIAPGRPLDLSITFSNPSGAAIGFIRKIRLFHSAHEPALDAGETFNPDYLAQIPRCSRVRFMKNTSVEHGRSVAAVMNETRRTWQAVGAESNAPVELGVPYSVAAKLAAKLKCDLQISIPFTASDALMAAAAAQIASVADFSGKVYAEAGNEGWNASYGNNYADLAALGAPLKPSGRPSAEAWVALRWWKAMETAIGRKRVKRVLASQAAGQCARGGYADLMLKYVDPGIIEAGTPVKELVDQMQIAPYTHFTDPAGQFLGGAVLKNLDAAALSDATMDAYFDRGSKIAGDWVTNTRTNLSAVRPGRPIELDSYEWGQETYCSLGGPSVFTFTINEKNNTGLLNTGPTKPQAFPIPKMVFKDGDVCYLYKNLDPGTSWDNSEFSHTAGNYNVPHYIKRNPLSADEFWLFASDAARLADTGNSGAGAISLNAAHPSYNHAIDNVSAQRRWITRFQAYLDSPAGLRMYQRYYERTVGPGKLLKACIFYDIGGYAGGTAWGLKASIYSPDTPRSLWARSL